MGNCRILHCGESRVNYNLCITKKVAGFTRRVAEKGDLIYFSIKIGKKTLCGARGILGDPTDYKPWKDSERYLQCFRVINMEYCEPFDVSILKEYGGPSWGGKYLQGSKAIKEEEAIKCLEIMFEKNKRNEPYIFEQDEEINDIAGDNNNNDDTLISGEEIIDDELDNFSEEDRLDIMGTFQTIRFKNETDPVRGLEPLVTEYFYKLFQHFSEEKTIMIADNRLFATVGLKNEKNENILGIKSIPDALLISYDKDSNNTPIRINLIEYECYGESKYRTSQKFNYLNGVIIPQLIRFASTFSIVTDNKIREKTIDDWIEKIMSYIDKDELLTKKVYRWMTDLYPDIKERQIDRFLEKELRNAFQSNIKIILIIDELTVEQKETIKNIINSFKLSNNNSFGKDNCIEFSSYVVRLEEKIGVFDKDAHFALSFQD
ncbi:hypothetical protein [Acetivibrio clariflavus]|uniref:hypothetical protein n=1 Tax=Acetivibrio clariflavus TaxID=288965 RepID=UPI0004846D01|nr:hypothetical protein [Acetivibrio clariflavus]